MSYTRRRVVGKRRTASPEWRNRQTHETQNLAFLTGRAGSTPASGTINEVARLRGLAVSGWVTQPPRPRDSRPRHEVARLRGLAVSGWVTQPPRPRDPETSRP